MRIKRNYIFLLTVPVLCTWILTSFILFPFKFITDSPKVKMFLNELTQFENDLKNEITGNQEALQQLESEMDNKLDRIKKDGRTVNGDERLQNLKNTYVDGPVIPVLVIACNRVTVTRCLDQLIKYQPSTAKFPIIVSLDCQDSQTKSAILKYGNKLTLIEQPDHSEVRMPPKQKKFKGYFKISRHYGWALNQAFFKYKFDSVIIVEDDLDIAPDFFEYFEATHKLLKHDPSLWCISAWNDNGKTNLVDLKNGSTKLYRTDFFPGLGWMLTKELWKELAPKWPRAFWDDWIRQPEQRNNRACIRPEISRTRTFGKNGVSNGLFYEKHLKHIYLNEKFVPFLKMDLSYLLKGNYDRQFYIEVYHKSKEISYLEYKNNPEIGVTSPPLRITYVKDTFKNLARNLGLMDDFKSGVPRTAYKGVITFSLNGRTAYLAPSKNWTRYDQSWS